MGDILVEGLFIEIHELRIIQISFVSCPFIHFHASLNYIKIGIQVVPKLLVVLIIGWSGLIVAIDLPIRTPILALGNVLCKFHEHILIMCLQPHEMSSHGFVGNIAHTKGFSTRKGGFIP